MPDFRVPGIPPAYSGKVRDIYDLGDALLMVATDRISAFDVVLPQPIPDKGAILTQLTRFWLEHLPRTIEHHMLSTDAADLPEPFAEAARGWGPRFMKVKKLAMVPIECVVRGYLAGSGWKEYSERGTVCGIGLPKGLLESSRLDDPIFTPATKATEGHDVNISAEEASRLVGAPLVRDLERRAVEIFEFGREWARERGLILADTKLEFGREGGRGAPVLADEVLTADSSRYWPADRYRPGGSPPSFDKQYVRDFLTAKGWRGDGPPPALPAEVVEGTAERYRELYRRITGTAWESAR
jgi:phosphoribosylaminoimidazole-succinocarboxamide synthase